MALSTVVYHASNATSLVPAWGKGVAMVTGYLSLPVAVLFGTLRTIDNLQRLF